MLSSIDQLTTVLSNAPMPFWEKIEPVSSSLYFHLVLRIDGGLLSDEQELKLKKYIAGFVRRTGGHLKSVSFAQNRVHLLVGLSQFCALGTFVRELKLVSAAYANRKLGAADFVWREKYDAFTVSFSQIERVRSYLPPKPAHRTGKLCFELESSCLVRALLIKQFFKRRTSEEKRVCFGRLFFIARKRLFGGRIRQSVGRKLHPEGFYH